MTIARWPWTLITVGSLVAGCGGSRSAQVPAGDPARSSEAAETERLEREAASYEERFREIQASEASPEEKADAASRLVDEQQRALRDAAEREPGAPADEGEEEAP